MTGSTAEDRLRDALDALATGVTPDPGAREAWLHDPTGEIVR